MSHEREKIYVRSSVDGDMEPSLFYRASGDEARPLLVGLHTWSFDMYNQEGNMLPFAKKYNFHLLLPDFRGPNTAENHLCIEACASDYALGDIFDAIEYVKENYPVDEEQIFLLGSSGGGHAALMCASRKPKLFRAIACFVPITDLYAWTLENSNYKNNVYACCSNDVREMARRSPINYVESISEANLKIFHGKYDTVVPFAHSIRLYEKILAYNNSSRTFLEIFDGGHQMSMDKAFDWFLSQSGKEKLTVVSG